jgi:alkanesulfonate monooxygenase SsuD/methylene tetrahydromethanopterin reductase-like flavin-dependent oxidoreductase (luciferase family)
MSRRLKVAVMLHPGADGEGGGGAQQARYAEQLGLDGIFVGDHLKPAGPYPESLVVLAAAAAVTDGTEAWEASASPTPNVAAAPTRRSRACPG